VLVQCVILRNSCAFLYQTRKLTRKEQLDTSITPRRFLEADAINLRFQLLGGSSADFLC
jgi:hypothetical protein